MINLRLFSCVLDISLFLERCWCVYLFNMLNSLGGLTPLWVLLAGFLFLLTVIRNRYQKGLSKFRGPFLASFTDLWRAWQAYQYPDHLQFVSWQESYGDVIRLGPNLIGFADPSCIKEIYTSGYDKV